MKKLAHFKLEKEYAVFCPAGQMSLAEVIELMSRAVHHCRDHKIEKLLIDLTGLPGLPTPGVTERYLLAERIAAAAKSSVKIAQVASSEWVRTGKFGVLVAKNRGLEAQDFTSRSTALEWLLKSTGDKADRSDQVKPDLRFRA